MSKSAKIWLIIAASLVVIGCIIFGGAMTLFKWDFTKLSTLKYETNDYEINEEYKNISIVTHTADILFVPCENQETSVVCHEQKNVKHSVTVKDGALVIEVVDTRKWYEYIGINFDTTKITVYIPRGEYGALSIKDSTGDVEIPSDFKFESIDISVTTGDVNTYASASKLTKIKTSTGNIRIENVFADTLDLSVSTGDISLTNVIATQKLSILSSTGNVKFDGCDAAEIFVKTSTGDVTGSLLTEKVFIAESDTGNVNVPKTVNGGRCEVTVSTGNIRLEIK